MMEWSQIPFGWREALDITVVTFLLYHVIRFVRGTRAVAALSGLFVLLVLYAVAQMTGLLTLSWLLENVFGSLFLVIVILFQQDIRQALSSMSLRSLFHRRSGGHEELIGTLVRTCFDLAAKHVGALIVIEMSVPLGDMMEKGVKIDGMVSEDLLSTIFFPKTALHDGAVIVNVSGRVVAAGCVLPLAQEVARQHFGTRHRAALGITEVSDAVVLVVSEERGEVTVARDGRLSNPLNYERLERMLTNVLSH